jgi:hypothetical protein
MRVSERLSVLGLPAVLGAADRDAVIAAPMEGRQVVVVTAREDAEMARETRAALGR